MEPGVGGPVCANAQAIGQGGVRSGAKPGAAPCDAAIAQCCPVIEARWSVNLQDLLAQTPRTQSKVERWATRHWVYGGDAALRFPDSL